MNRIKEEFARCVVEFLPFLLAVLSFGFLLLIAALSMYLFNNFGGCVQ